MLNKTMLKGGTSCRVTFILPGDAGADHARLLGEFDDWSEPGRELIRRKAGYLSTSLTLRTGRSYRFRYRLGEGRWANDPQADDYVPNPYGTEDSVLAL